MTHQGKQKYVVDETGLPRNAEDVRFVDKVLNTKNKKDKWAVIELLLQFWVKKTPEEAQALKIQIDDQRETLNDKEFGQTKGGKDFLRRFTLVFPLHLMLMLRSVYAEEELPMDQAFYKEFARRFPAFKIAEKN